MKGYVLLRGIKLNKKMCKYNFVGQLTVGMHNHLFIFRIIFFFESHEILTSDTKQKNFS